MPLYKPQHRQNDKLCILRVILPSVKMRVEYFRCCIKKKIGYGAYKKPFFVVWFIFGKCDTLDKRPKITILTLMTVSVPVSGIFFL